MEKGAVTIIKTYFSKRPSVLVVYLYGSQAKGLAKDESDIDLGVVLKKSVSTKAFDLPQITFSQELTKKLGKQVEIQDLRTCRVDFTHRVISEGKLLYIGDEKERVEFEMEIFRKYFDLKPYFEEYYQNLSKITKKGELNVRYT